MNTNEILEKLGIEMNAMQNEAYDAILHSRNDVVVLSPTGSGKTLAYLMPLVQLVDADSDEVQAVVITPDAGIDEVPGPGMSLYGVIPVTASRATFPILHDAIAQHDRRRNYARIGRSGNEDDCGADLAAADADGVVKGAQVIGSKGHGEHCTAVGLAGRERAGIHIEILVIAHRCGQSLSQALALNEDLIRQLGANRGRAHIKYRAVLGRRNSWPYFLA